MAFLVSLIKFSLFANLCKLYVTIEIYFEYCMPVLALGSIQMFVLCVDIVQSCHTCILNHSGVDK